MKKLFFGLILICVASYAQDHDHSTMEHDHEAMMKEQAKVNPLDVGVKEKLGAQIPLDLQFTDSEGNKQSLGSLIDRPTLILFVFYHCAASCNVMLENLANALKGMDDYKSYRAISISFDDEEMIGAAQKRRKDFLHILGDHFPESNWKFLMGDHHSIMMTTKTLGYRFQKVGKHNFTHPNVLIALSPEGKVIRYLYGPEFLPFDIGMAVAEAMKGNPVTSIKKLASLCFTYDPKEKRYIFNYMQVLGASVLFAILLFVLFVTLGKKKNQFN